MALIETVFQLQYCFPSPAHHPGVVLLVTCVFGIAYLAFGNVAASCLACATSILEASGMESSHGRITGLAITIATFASILHAITKRGSIVAINFFAMVKASIALAIFTIGICIWTGDFKTGNRATNNLSPGQGFKNLSAEPSEYSSAFVAIMFAYSGFEQSAYVST